MKINLSEIAAFSVDQVERLTALTKRQLRYWDKTGFFQPEVVDPGNKTFGRIYSFRDVVGLRTLAAIRQHVSLQEMRVVAEWLTNHFDHPWSSLRFYVFNRKVYFDDPESGLRLDARTGKQAVLEFAIDTIAHDITDEVRKLRKRTANEFGQITRNRYVAHNAHVIAGTRIPTAAVWSFRKAGYTHDQILREYPSLTRKDVRAAIAFEKQRTS
jgi:uncharacterized protein (DUF433 family)